MKEWILRLLYGPTYTVQLCLGFVNEQGENEVSTDKWGAITVRGLKEARLAAALFRRDNRWASAVFWPVVRITDENGEPVSEFDMTAPGKCPRTKFPDGTRCGEYEWHAKNCPERTTP